MTNPEYDVVIKTVSPMKSEGALQKSALMELLHHILQDDNSHERRHLYEHSN